jgi:hypothetical protein
LELEAGRKRERRAYERDVQLAFLTEYMARQDKLGPESIRKLLPRTGQRKQTPAEQRVVAEQIRVRYGLKPYFRPHPSQAPA